MGITYKSINGFPGYRVSSDGRVQSSKLGDWRDLSLCTCCTGYLQVNLHLLGKKHTRKVHRLILESFVGPCPEGQQARHLDGNKLNNRLDNLAWGSIAENVRDRKESGQPWSPRRLDEQKVKLIWRRRSEGATIKQIAAELGVTMKLVDSVLYGRNWRWVQIEVDQFSQSTQTATP